MSDSKLERLFLAFHTEHPQVLTLLAIRALNRVSKGEQRLSIKALFEEIRGIVFDSPGARIKLNNNHTPFYVRMLVAEYPSLAGRFVMKRQRIQASFGPNNSTLQPAEHYV